MLELHKVKNYINQQLRNRLKNVDCVKTHIIDNNTIKLCVSLKKRGTNIYLFKVHKLTNINVILIRLKDKDITVIYTQCLLIDKIVGEIHKFYKEVNNE